MPRSSPTVMSALGFPRHLDRLYTRVLPQTGREVVSVAAALLHTPDELVAELEPLVAQGLVSIEEGRVFVLPPADAVVRWLEEISASAARSHERLREISAAIPFLAGASARPGPGEVHDVHPLDGEVSSGGAPMPLIQALIRQSQGDILWLRPDQWRIPREDLMAGVVGEAIATGRRSRAIYPVRALSEARATLQARVDVGEEIRVLPDLPTRMFIIGATHAVLPEPLGFVDEPRSLIRQRGLVEALTHWFEMLWEKAAPVDLQGGESRPDLRRFLLMQLAAGAQDEQIARRLGVSLRTVRRRVADILTELGADTRFQAGVEAVRRGWL